MSPRFVEGKVLRHRGGENRRCYVRGYVKPKHEFNYQQAVEAVSSREDPAQTERPGLPSSAYPSPINLKQEEQWPLSQVEEMAGGEMPCCMAKYTMEGESVLIMVRGGFWTL